MKKLGILLLSIFMITNFSAIAQAEATIEKEVTTEKLEKECSVIKNDEGQLICAKTGKVCDATCEKKKTNSCCKGEKSKSSCCKSKKGSFNFNKSNNYNGKSSSSCSKSKVKGCCKSKAKASNTEEKTTEEKSQEG